VFLRLVFRRADYEHSYGNVPQVEMFYGRFIDIKRFVKRSSNSPAKAKVKMMYLNLNSAYSVNHAASMVILVPYCTDKSRSSWYHYCSCYVGDGFKYYRQNYVIVCIVTSLMVIA
jgi:hypothetical protein